MTDYSTYDYGSRRDWADADGDSVVWHSGMSSGIMLTDYTDTDLRGLASLLREQIAAESPPESPSHYKSNSGIECIDAIRAAMTAEEYRGFLRGNAIKYLWRCAKKGAPAEDLRKAQTYIGWLISAYGEE